MGRSSPKTIGCRQGDGDLRLPWGGLGVASLLALHQQWLIRDRDPDRCFRAFLGNNLFGLAVFAGILLHYLFAG